MAVFLGIETSGTTTGMALVENKRILSETTRPGVRHDEFLLELVENTLRAAGVEVKALSGIGVSIGPGMFTSLRVGLATAKGLAIPHSIPIKGINTLLALATAASEHDRPVLALVDARKKQVYAALYQAGRPLLGPEVIFPEELGPKLAAVVALGNPLPVAGNGVAACLPAFEKKGVKLILTAIENPPPHVIARLAADRIATGDEDDIERLEPLYLRRTDAEMKRAAATAQLNREQPG